MGAESAITAGGTQPGTGPLSAVCRTVSDPPPPHSSVERLSREGLAGVAHLGACREVNWWLVGGGIMKVCPQAKFQMPT